MKMGHVIQVWGKPSKLLFRVKDHGDEWRSRHVLSAPPHLGIVGCHTLAFQALRSHLDSIVAGLGGLVLAEDRPVLLTLPLHLHTERALWSSDPHCQLTSTSTASVADEPTLIPERSSLMFD